jgi:hypothetical protein
MTALDTTKYDPKATPHLQLRALFAQQNLDGALRKALADRGFISVELLANAGDSATAALNTITGLVTEGWPEGSGRPMEEIKLKAVWDAARQIATSKGQQAAKYAEDPSKIPSIPENERVVMRQAWTAAHRGHDLHDWNEPHPRFLDRVKRDWQLHGRVPFYEISEIRVVADKVITKPAVALQADKLLQFIEQEQPGAPVNSSDQLFDRLHALFVALEMLTIFQVEEFYTVSTRYMQELRLFFRHHDEDVQLAVKTDRLLRKEAQHLSLLDPAKDYASCILEVLTTKQYLWGAALVEVETARLKGAAHPAKRQADSPVAQGSVATPPKKRRRKGKAAAASPPSAAKHQQSHKAQKAAPSPPKGGKGDSKRVPQAEMNSLWELARANSDKQICKFYNSSVGCSRGSGCSFKHVCLKCNQKHPAHQH